MTDQERLIPKIWQAFAVGDACGMPTEFMTPEDIAAVTGGALNGLLPASCSYNHSDLARGCVTDDTEQNLYLLEAFRRRGGAFVPDVVDALKRWIAETDAVGKHYIGPSSLKALKAIEEGTEPEKAGMGGTTCGGMMRTPAAVLWAPEQTEEELIRSIRNALLPTHNSSEALEAAGAYGFALMAALRGASLDEIFATAEQGAESLISLAPYRACAPSSAARIRAAKALKLPEEELKALLFSVWGTGLPSADVCGAVFAVFAFAGRDVWKAIRLSSVLGGDTDTIAALAGALSAAYAGGHNIPEEVVETVLRVNRSLFEAKCPEALRGED